MSASPHKLKLTDYVAAGYFISKRSKRDDARSPDLLPTMLLSASTCICPHIPDDWAITWVKGSEDDRKTKAACFGLVDDRLEEFVTWVTANIDVPDGALDWPVSIKELETARWIVQEFKLNTSDLVLFGLAIHSDHVRKFLKATEVQPGIGKPRYGIERLKRLDSSGEFLGFEPLACDLSGISCSWLCNLLEQPIANDLGIRPNEHGFIDSAEAADQAVKYISRPDVGTEPGLWLPWLVVQYDLAPAKG